MTRFRNLFDLLKLSILKSYQTSNFFARQFARGINGLQAIITSNKILSRQADDLGKQHANMKFVKTLWNMAETGLPEKVVSWMKPGIKYVSLLTFLTYWPFMHTFLSGLLTHDHPECVNTSA